MNTVTCAGHATIGTGAYPHTHGMTLNAWYDRTRRTSVSCTDDADSTLVSYGREGRIGTSGRLLLAPTLADELRGTSPEARVVTMALKARSAIGLAGHAGTAVTWIDDGAGSFVTAKAFAPAPVAAIADFLKRDPIDADATKSWTLRDAPATYRYPDSSVGARPPSGRTNFFPHRVGTAKPLTTEDPFGKNEAGNETWRRFRDHLKENGVDLAKTNFTMGRELKFDSKSETIAGDPEASKLLTREYRKPYVVPENV
jgi:hypothetical protein